MIYLGDCLEVMRDMEAGSIDTIITDPPYGLSFMGKKWDYDVPSVEIWEECLRVLKPGGTAMIFAGSRTQHRMAVNVEDAGFILKDCIMWLYGSGFPKARDIGRDVEEFEGWKSHGLKPAYEPILVAMKPNDGTYAQNAMKHGVSGLNIEGGRVPANVGDRQNYGRDHDIPYMPSSNSLGEFKINKAYTRPPQGRFPANIILDEEAAEVLGEPSRFFYCAKASKKERNAGCEGLEALPKSDRGADNMRDKKSIVTRHRSELNNHPTVKPLKLMEYLCTLTKTPTGGIVLDPFAGSGTTGIACQNTNRDYVLIEQKQEYIDIAKARLKNNERGLYV